MVSGWVGRLSAPFDSGETERRTARQVRTGFAPCSVLHVFPSVQPQTRLLTRAVQTGFLNRDRKEAGGYVRAKSQLATDKHG
jgi:hypothetical protein